jgi:thiamine biosynthesis lipoprotein
MRQRILNEGLTVKQDFIMDTAVDQQIFAGDAPFVYEQTVSLLRQTEERMSFFRPGSEIHTLNALAGTGKATPLHPDTLRVLTAAQEYCTASGGAFDVTAAPLMACWREGKIPSEATLTAARALVGNQYLQLDPVKGTALLTKKGCAVDLGGIAKGYAADLALALYRAQGVTSALINLGGNVQTLGRKPDGSPWAVGLQHPHRVRGAYFGVVYAEDASVVTSGGYERFLEIGSEKYHHILDPQTGFPAASGLLSATVVSPDSMRADALSTAVFVLGRERGRLLLQSYPDAGAVLLDKQMQVWVTQNLRDKFRLTPEFEGAFEGASLHYC